MSDANNDRGKHEFSIELGVAKFEGRSDDPEWLEKMFDKFLPPALQATSKLATRISSSEQPEQLTLLPEADTLSTSPSDSVPTTETVETDIESDLTDLCTFYRKLDIKSQSDQIAAITYWYKHHGQEQMVQDDYLEAYRKLQYVGLALPEKDELNTRIANARRQAKVIYNVSKGVYAINQDGEKRVAEMRQSAA